MARTRERQFLKLISRFTTNINDLIIPKPTLDDIHQKGLMGEVFSIYQKLGGVLAVPPCRIGGWDFVINGKVIELDEEAHFNRYRAITLSSSIYDSISYFNVPRYQHYCSVHEGECIAGRSFGGYWTNDSAEKQFGSPSRTGDLMGNGSPRWKQRAFYDFIKDLTPHLYHVPVLRISIYDELVDKTGVSITINRILESLDDRNASLLYERIIE